MSVPRSADGDLALDRRTAVVLDWNPETYGGLFEVRNDEVLLGGNFAFAGPIPTCGLARDPLAPPLNSGGPAPQPSLHSRSDDLPRIRSRATP
jgi:hypothetical protein